jgi:protein-S-isoprenylcysteine O-methyltransferase Ste14
MSRYYKLAQKEHSLGTRILVTLPVGIIVVILIPYLVVWVGPILDGMLGLQGFQIGVVNFILGGLMAVAGLTFGIWSNLVQFEQGRGSPIPVMPTQELLIKGPYRYCRNPMTFGTILFYLGLGVAVGTVAGIGIALIFAGLLILYLKRVEERELAERFGEAYLRYKQEVPFIIPRLPRRLG